MTFLPKIRIKLSLNKEDIVVLLFLTIMVFQLTELRHIWGIQSVGRLINLTMLGVLALVGLASIFAIRYSVQIWFFYIIPALLVFTGMFINIAFNVLKNTQLISYFGLLLPWAAFLIAPFFYKLKLLNTARLWNCFYYFLLVSIVLSLGEYFLILGGYLVPSQLILDNGIFLSGRFTLFHMLEDESPHQRFYSSFAEPGTLAMYLLPAIAYSIFNKKYIGLILFLVAFYFTGSLGGIFGLIMLILIIPFFLVSPKYILIAFLGFCVIGSITYGLIGEELSMQYENKDESRTTREESLNKSLVNLSTAILIYPLGMPLSSTTGEAENNSLYFGSNFTPGYMYVLGGIFSCFGYILCLLVSLSVSGLSMLKKSLLTEEKIIFISIIVLFPFIFQRQTVWDSAIFAFLFAPALFKFFDAKKKIQFITS